jgi:DNA-binding NarL/FixJ family response regulator
MHERSILLTDSQPPQGMLVVDDHDLVRLGLQTLVQEHAQSHGHEVQIFEARTLQEALLVYRQHAGSIGLVLLDLHLPDAHGLSGLTTFVARFPQARIVVLSGSSEPTLMRHALASGATHYLTKSGDLKEVVSYIRSQGLLAPADAVRIGLTTEQPDQAVAGQRTVRNAAGQVLQLTARQAEVLDWILAGHSNREIAHMADLSEGTIKNLVSTLLLLFGARSRAQLVSQLR